MTFRSYRLIRLNQAIGQSQIETMCDYDVTIVDNFGRTNTMVMKLHHIDQDWCKLRMKGDRFAKLDGGKCFPITEEEYYSLIEIHTVVETTQPLDKTA